MYADAIGETSAQITKNFNYTDMLLLAYARLPLRRPLAHECGPTYPGDLPLSRGRTVGDRQSGA